MSQKKDKQQRREMRERVKKLEKQAATATGSTFNLDGKDVAVERVAFAEAIQFNVLVPSGILQPVPGGREGQQCKPAVVAISTLAELIAFSNALAARKLIIAPPLPNLPLQVLAVMAKWLGQLVEKDPDAAGKATADKVYPIPTGPSGVVQ